jgi:hypothetical protein
MAAMNLEIPTGPARHQLIRQRNARDRRLLLFRRVVLATRQPPWLGWPVVGVFPRDTELSGGQDRAFALAQNSFVSMFFRRSMLEDFAGWLREQGYQLVEVDCQEPRDSTEMLVALGRAFSFPEYYGRNLNALNDCMRDVAGYHYGALDSATGTVLILNRYDAFAALDGNAAHAILDIFAGQARSAALIGHRMLCLVQSNDPRLTFEPVGAMPVIWNPREWLDSSRRS